MEGGNVGVVCVGGRPRPSYMVKLRCEFDSFEDQCDFLFCLHFVPRTLHHFITTRLFLFFTFRRYTCLLP